MFIHSFSTHRAMRVMVAGYQTMIQLLYRRKNRHCDPNTHISPQNTSMWPLSAPPPDTFNTILITSLGEEMQASVRSHFYTILKPAQNKSPYLLSPPTRKGHHTKSAIKELTTEHNTITFKTAVTHTQSKKRSYFK